MRDNLDISVLIATYNRAEILCETLDAMTRLEWNGLSVEFVIVDNNSSDHTKQMIESFKDRLPILYLFEPRQGKNCALNRALDEVSLGRVVVFTDDDVEPQSDWLKAIESITKRKSEYNVFGGKVTLIMPDIELPYWEQIKNVTGLRFGAHGLADVECPFPAGRFPSGSNLWVSRHILKSDFRFDEFFGPRPDSRIMGSESTFIRKLTEDGHEIFYSPHAVVRHRLQPEMLSLSGIKERVCRAGRTSPHFWGLKPRKLYEQHRFLWWLLRTLALAKCLLKYIVAKISLSRCQRVVRTLKALNGIAYNIESLKIAYGDLWSKA